MNVNTNGQIRYYFERVAYNNKGSQLFRKKQYQQSLNIYKQGIKLFKQTPKQYYDLLSLIGGVYYKMGNSHQALLKYDQVLDNYPNDQTTLKRRLRIYRQVNFINQKNMHLEAIQDIKLILTQTPDCQETLKILEQILEKIEKMPQNKQLKYILKKQILMLINADQQQLYQFNFLKKIQKPIFKKKKRNSSVCFAGGQKVKQIIAEPSEMQKHQKIKVSQKQISEINKQQFKQSVQVVAKCKFALPKRSILRKSILQPTKQETKQQANNINRKDSFIDPNRLLMDQKIITSKQMSKYKKRQSQGRISFSVTSPVQQIITHEPHIKVQPKFKPGLNKQGRGSILKTNTNPNSTRYSKLMTGNRGSILNAAQKNKQQDVKALQALKKVKQKIEGRKQIKRQISMEEIAEGDQKEYSDADINSYHDLGLDLTAQQMLHTIHPALKANLQSKLPLLESLMRTGYKRKTVMRKCTLQFVPKNKKIQQQNQEQQNVQDQKGNVLFRNVQ